MFHATTNRAAIIDYGGSATSYYRFLIHYLHKQKIPSPEHLCCNAVEILTRSAFKVC